MNCTFGKQLLSCYAKSQVLPFPLSITCHSVELHLSHLKQGHNPPVTAWGAAWVGGNRLRALGPTITRLHYAPLPSLLPHLLQVS